jgi:hypothetical protein
MASSSSSSSTAPNWSTTPRPGHPTSLLRISQIGPIPRLTFDTYVW